MNPKLHSRVLRQFESLLAQLKREIEFPRQNKSRIRTLRAKIRALLTKLLDVFPARHLALRLGALTLFIGFSGGGAVKGQSFAAPLENPFGYVFDTTDARMIDLVDLDNDGDLDLLASSYYGDISYYQNVGTPQAPAFAAPQTNPFGIVPASVLAAPEAVDLDGDGDFDLIVGEEYGMFKYYQNVGTATSPAFAAPQTNPFGLTAVLYYNFPAAMDMDGDGDFDLLVGEEYGNLKYFENVGTATAPSFTTPAQNPFNLGPGMYIAFPDAADLDGDGDLDIIIGEYYGIMQYYENIGNATSPNFGPKQANPFGLVAVNYIAVPAFGDLDGDGDYDLLVGEYYGSVQYFENTAPVAVDEALEQSVRVYPNPVQDVLHIETSEQIEKLEIYSLTGALLTSRRTPDKILDMSALPSGMYIVRLWEQGKAPRSIRIEKL